MYNSKKVLYMYSIHCIQIYDSKIIIVITIDCVDIMESFIITRQNSKIKISKDRISYIRSYLSLQV